MGQVFAIFKPEEKEVSINNSSKEETPVTRAGGINVVDPRSPTTNFERTPIITNGRYILLLSKYGIMHNKLISK